MTEGLAEPKLHPEIIRGRGALGGGLKSMGSVKPATSGVAALPALRGKCHFKKGWKVDQGSSFYDEAVVHRLHEQDRNQ